MSLLLGIDEGTSAVKAILFDEDLRPRAEARREKPLSHPRPGWVEQDPAAILSAVTEAVAELLEAADEEVVACGLDHQGESILAWDAETGGPLTPVITWQDKRSQEILDRLVADGTDAEVVERSGMPLDPYFSAGKLAWLLEHDDRVADAVKAGTARLGTVDSFLCDRLGAGFATDPATASRTQLGAPDWDQRLLEIFGVPAAALPRLDDTVGELGTLSHPDWPVELPLRARCPTSRRHWRARGASSAASPRRRTGPGCSCSRTRATSGRSRREGCCPRSPGASTAGSNGRSTAACSPRASCSSG